MDKGCWESIVIKRIANICWVCVCAILSALRDVITGLIFAATLQRSYCDYLHVTKDATEALVQITWLDCRPSNCTPGPHLLGFRGRMVWSAKEEFLLVWVDIMQNRWLGWEAGCPILRSVWILLSEGKSVLSMTPAPSRSWVYRENPTRCYCAAPQKVDPSLTCRWG